jgi:hypothetical protein
MADILMNTAILLLAMMPCQPGGRGSSDGGGGAIAIRLHVGPTVNTRSFRSRLGARKLSITGDNNTVVFYYGPTDSSFNYYSKAIRRRPFFWRRRMYPR